MAVARVADRKFKPGQRERGERERDAMGSMFSFPGVVGTIWLDSTEDPDVRLSVVVFEGREAMEANGKDPRFRAGIKGFEGVVERIPPELSVYDVDLVKVREGFGERA